VPRSLRWSASVRPLAHVLLAGLLGILATMFGAQVVLVGFVGGYVLLVVGVLVVTAAVSGLAVALDRSVGPGLNGTAGSVNRGTLLGVAGCASVLAIGLWALGQDIGDGTPVLLRYAAAGPVFAAIAALQWPGLLRRVTAAVLVVAAGVLLGPRLVDQASERRTEAIVTEIGTTARPWVTEVEGLDGLAPRSTGSEYLWTGYVAEGDPTPVVSLVRMPNAAAMGGDPCRGAFHTPEGTFEPTSCRTPDGVTWRREATPYWHQLVRRVDGTWLGATARPDVPERLLEQALDNARQMSDDAYDDWLDAVLTVPLS
jgi:hypothetical protein